MACGVDPLYTQSLLTIRFFFRPTDVSMDQLSLPGSACFRLFACNWREDEVTTESTKCQTRLTFDGIWGYLSVNSPALELFLLTLTVTLTIAVNSCAGELTDKNPYERHKLIGWSRVNTIGVRFYPRVILSETLALSKSFTYLLTIQRNTHRVHAAAATDSSCAALSDVSAYRRLINVCGQHLKSTDVWRSRFVAWHVSYPDVLQLRNN